MMRELDLIRVSEQYMELARQAGIVPRDMNAAQVQAIIIAGQELGLQPLQSLRTMGFVNGRLVMAVQLQLALARQKAGVQVESLQETEEACTVTLARGAERVTCTYTLQDARRAGLDKGTNWQKYPRQMLRWRAIGDALRIIAPDVVMGLLAPEEAELLEPPSLAPSEPEPAPELICAECGRALRQAQYDLSVRKHGRPLCPACQRNERENEPEPQNAGNGHDPEPTTLLRDLKARNPAQYQRVLGSLHRRANRVFPDDEARRAWLKQNWRVESFTELTVEQAREAYRLMEACG